MIGMTRNGHTGKWNSTGSSASGANGPSASKLPANMMAGNRLRETIHSGHFMVSDFEPESEVQDDEYEAGLSVPEEGAGGQHPPVTSAGVKQEQQLMIMSAPSSVSIMSARNQFSNPGFGHPTSGVVAIRAPPHLNMLNTNIIDGSLTKLFQCMTLAYRQKLTSPKWNRFKGVRLRWKDKIRLNNVIWRCWHMQFILRQKALVCQFASPLDVDQHNKPEAVVMEGKYWKRKLSTVAAEYKKWRLFYRNRIMGNIHLHPLPDLHPVSLDGFDWNRGGTFGGGPISSFMFDDDLLMDFSDTLFSSLSCQQLPFPNPREISRAGMVADFIQPGLVQLQPNLDEFMDTFEPLQDFISSKYLPSVPEGYENMEPPDNLMTSDSLPNMMKSETLGMTTHSYHKLNNVQPQQQDPSMLQQQAPMSAYSSRTDNQVSLSGYTSPLTQLITSPSHNSSQSSSNPSSRPPPGNLSSGSTSSSRSSIAGRKENQHSLQSRASSSSAYARNDVFIVPKIKPRGKANRGSNNSRQMLPPNPIPLPPEPANAMQHTQQQQQQQHHHQPAVQNQLGHHQPMPHSMMNANTLLSHLLTNSNSGHGANTHYTGGTMQDKLGNIQGGGGNMAPQMMTPSGVSGIMAGPVAPMTEAQQHHHQPWNAKNANDILNPNTPINFGANKPMLPVKYDAPMNLGFNNASGGDNSPPLLSNTPSPPMGPPGGPVSPSRSFRPKGDNEREHRRVCHINAEQKRRCNIKNGFDMLHSLVPQLSHNPNAKVSKAAMLQKGAEYIRQLKIERTQLKQEIESHRQEVEALNATISNCQLLLPATGAPVSRQRTNKMKEMFDNWVRMRTAENWRFWIFSILIRPLLDTFNNSVSTSSVEELCRTVLAWVDQHCSLVDLRPAVLNSLRYLCTSTDILSNPANLPEEAARAVNRQDSSNDGNAGNGEDS